MAGTKVEMNSKQKLIYRNGNFSVRRIFLASRFPPTDFRSALAPLSPSRPVQHFIYLHMIFRQIEFE